MRVPIAGLLLILIPVVADSSDESGLGPIDVLISAERESEVPARELGMLIELSVQIGDYVEAGETLGRVDDASARVHRDRAEIDLQVAIHELENDLQVQLAEKALGVAEADLRRAYDANEERDNTISAAEVQRREFVRDRAALEVEQATRNRRKVELAVEQARMDVSLAELEVQRRVLVAPIGGRVVDVQCERGEWVQPGETIVTIISTHRVLAEALVTADTVPEDVTGHAVRIEFSRSGRPAEFFDGTITFVDPRKNDVNGQFSLRAEIENPDRTLRPGDHATMTILPAAARETRDQ